MSKLKSAGPLGACIGTALAAAACATPPAPARHAAASEAPAERQRCFRPADVNGWRAGDRETVYVRVGVNRVYRMRLMGPCPDINWSEAIGVEAQGSPWICSDIHATIIAPSAIGPRRCPVTGLQELSAAEIAALPRGQRP